METKRRTRKPKKEKKEEKKEQDNMYTVLVKRKRNNAVVRQYHLEFESPFEAFEWGERQAKEFGPGYFAELGAKPKK